MPLFTREQIHDELKKLMAKNSATNTDWINADPLDMGKKFNRKMGELAEIFVLYSAATGVSVGAMMEIGLGMLLDEYKKAVIEEYIASGTRDKLDEVLKK